MFEIFCPSTPLLSGLWSGDVRARDSGCRSLVALHLDERSHARVFSFTSALCYCPQPVSVLACGMQLRAFLRKVCLLSWTEKNMRPVRLI